MKKFVGDRKEMFSRWDSYSLEDLIATCTAAVQELSEGAVHPLFTIDMRGDGYNPAEYPYLILSFQRLETDEEEHKREEREAETKERQRVHDLAQYKRLKEAVQEIATARVETTSAHPAWRCALLRVRKV
jgi:hypothetical protein